ncbi:purine operon repressor, PurR [Paenisporosarcina quisquiliarum]|jgi:purine operon repressor|uniref:Pur operon repressor n=1 Tax=Psychrobacillus psychrodurans TaxID=126157 RepID=A0A9X3RB73_9BACI|nr:pur operon repressor [Psychrobacillus psychrodurans]MCZ8535364.1 pur operon repressor [Psychrobacillus psychrodurans]MCZ8542067.1 pur operon repressor [Psychrobacillus psychrodurans]SEN95092.1 purine operon repressor, PurR [Paenisporosarcina quisquiliarum]SFN15909.1 purine operon repressor [Psychrobacillus psychrodurans]
MKWKRSERLVDMTQYLMEHPHKLIPLTFFASLYQSAKSSISEDLTIVKETFEERGRGLLVTVPGAAGGVKFIPTMTEEDIVEIAQELMEQLSKVDRLLPGGYLYMTDLLGNPSLMNKIGKVFASAFANAKIDAIMTVATKGIPIAHAIARHLNVPVVIVRRDSKVTEGPTVSINYVSGSARRIQTMVLSKRSMEKGQRVLITDDFMKVGGTINGMKSLLEEFNCELAGIAVLVEAEHQGEQLVNDHLSLVKLHEVNEKDGTIALTQGNYFEKGGNLDESSINN